MGVRRLAPGRPRTAWVRFEALDPHFVPAHALNDSGDAAMPVVSIAHGGRVVHHRAH